MSERIALSFLALAQRDFSYRIFRSDVGAVQALPEGARFLPPNLERAVDGVFQPERRPYRVSLLETDASESASISAWVDVGLTKNVLDHALREKVKATGVTDETVERNGFVRKIGFVLKRYEDDVRELIWVQPYALKALGKFGFLFEFALRIPTGTVLGDRRRLELSLTQKNGRINEDFYLDRYGKTEEFLRRYHGLFRRLTLHDGSEIEVEEKLSLVPCFHLSRRVFVFGGEKEGKSTFFGLRNHGPLAISPAETRLVFFFQGGDRSKSQDLFRALRGDTYATFPGMQQMFGIPFGRQNVSGIEIKSFLSTELRQACKALRSQYPHERLVPVVIAPMSKYSSDQETRDYYAAKHAFLSEGLSSQFVDRKHIEDRRVLQWSVSNIALGIFAKMGGVPWRLKPQTPSCLVVGIGQAHRIVNKKIERYFAYSVLADSSGIYEKIKVLGSSSNRDEYLRSLKDNLREVLLAHKGKYKSFVLHLTFSMKRREIEAIKDLLDEIRGREQDSPASEFVALRFNDHNDFFGFSVDHNSRVPYEGTVAPLSRSECLLWFSGLSIDDRKAPKKPERPVHIKVLYPERALGDEDLRRVLQDSMNIAGANWRGFNAKSLPISVYYAKLIATYCVHFREANLPELELENLSPWFL